MYRLLISICLLLLLALHQRSATAKDPPVMERIQNPDTNTDRYQYNIYDKMVTLADGVYYANPKWSREAGVKRGHKYTDAPFFLYDEYGDPEFNPVKIPFSTIKKIDYWESLALDHAKTLIKMGDLDDASALIRKVEQFNPDWRPDLCLLLTCQLEYQHSLQLLKSEQKNKFQQGLQKLEEIATSEVDLSEFDGFQNRYETAYLKLAARALDEKLYGDMWLSINQILTKYPQSEPANQFQQKIIDKTRDLLERAEQAGKEGKSRLAVETAIEAQQLGRNLPGLDQSVTLLLRQHQRLRIACYSRFATLDPFSAGVSERQIMPLLFDRLVEQGGRQGVEFYKGPLVAAMRQRPGFVKESDGTFSIAWEIELKPEIFFSDGTELTAGDVASTVELMQDPSGHAYDPEWARLVLGVTVEGARRFMIRFRQYARPESLMTFPIVPSSLVKIPESNDLFAKQPIGTGPFQVSEAYNPQLALELNSNPKFRKAPDGQPFIKLIQFQRYNKKGSGHAVEDMLQKKLELITDPSPIQLLRLVQAGQPFELRPFLSDSVWILAINHRRPIFQNRNVRAAFLHGIDREDLLTRWFSAGANNSSDQTIHLSHSLVSGPFPPHSNAYDHQLPVREYDSELSKTRLSSINPTETLTLKYASTGDLALERAMLQIGRSLESIGLKVQVQPKLPNDFTQEVLVDHDFDLAYYRIDHNNILFNISSFFDAEPEELGPGGSNFMGYTNQKLNQLFVELRNEQLEDAIWEKQKEIHRLMYQEIVFIPLWRLDSHLVFTDRLSGRSADGRVYELPTDRRNLFRRAEDWYLEPSE